MPNEILQNWFFKHSPSEVWEYLTNPGLIEQWLSKTDFKPIAGHKFHFADKSGKIIYCQVLEVEPFTRLSYSWQCPSAKDGERLDSKVVWTLIPKDNGTELQLQHDGFTFLEDVTRHNTGWSTCLQRMEGLLKIN